MLNDVLKLEYRRDYFDVTEMKPGAREIFVVVNDGSIVKRYYKPGSRKVHSVCKANCDPEAFKTLCQRISECIELANQLDFYVDDSSEELRIYHKYGRTQTMDRGLGNGNVHIGEIMNEFLRNYISE